MKPHHGTILVAILASSLILAPLFAPAQGPLTPPGAPAPTMKTLDQIEPRTPISALPFTISAAGSYFITGNLTGVAGQPGITVDASSVTLDLGGFELRGVATSTEGIRVVPGRTNVTIRNGTLSSWGAGTAAVQAVNNVIQVENIRVLFSAGGGMVLGPYGAAKGCEVRQCAGTGILSGRWSRIVECTTISNSNGIQVGDNSLVIHCVAAQNAGHGIQAGASNVVTGCVASDNGANGFSTGASGTLSGCVASDNGANGFSTGASGTLSGCVASGNVADGFGTGANGTLSDCSALSNSGIGFSASRASTIRSCVARTNGGNGFTVSNTSSLTACIADTNRGIAGIETLTGCALIGCTARGNASAAATSAGIMVQSGCLVSQCTASANSSTAAVLTSSTGVGILLGGACVVERCMLLENQGDGILGQGAANMILNNNCSANGLAGDGAGIHTTGLNNRIEGNNVEGNERGIDVDSVRSLIIKNTAVSNAIAYQIAANNRFGPIINISAAGPPAQTITDASASVPSTTGSTDPWANFVH